ncbi:tRNA uridine-5-carboxymethylaminomethyl(34) synthesis GTPase MnmE [Herpetosiphon gulosus]|uniref:tRNA modification GTPase MnmE n=1 Tax=Herpetosiphon gulosus TaxID=1973496 RepID=A0ABP9X3I2_9CHLR
MLYADTIAALATPPGVGGVGIIRISGPQSLAIAQALIKPRRKGIWRSYQMRYGHVLDEHGQVVDEVLAVFFKGPRSFTGEDILEIHCHGGPLPLRRTLTLALAHGARLANPGEFSLRAFANGRIDLVQAEATLDVIEAQTNLGLSLALDQLGGGLSRDLRTLREQLMYPLAYVTALTDFPEDDVPSEELQQPLQQAQSLLSQLLAGADQGVVVREGARAALVGRPNAGKSSLMNALLRTERAIVTAIPGTTRDTLEETANLGGIPVVLIDTAGITETDDLVERIGVERSRAALSKADLVLLLIDGSQPLSPEDLVIAQLTHERPTIVIATKADLGQHADLTVLTQTHPKLRGSIAISSQASTGLDYLGTMVAEQLLGGLPLSDARLVTNPRHREALRRANAALEQAIQGLREGRPVDLIAIDLHEAIASLGEITGETVEHDLLNMIFSRFCIGK